MHLRFKIAFKLLAVLLMATNCLQAQTFEERADSLKKAGLLKEALLIYEDILNGDIDAKSKNISKDYTGIANVYSDMGNYDKAAEFYYKAVKELEGTENKAELGKLYYNMANMYFSAGKITYCKEFLNKALKTVGNEKGSEFVLGVCYNMLGSIKSDEGNYDEGINDLKKAETIFETLKEINWLGNVYTNLSYAAVEKPDYKLAEEYGRKSLVIFKQNNDAVGVAAAYLNLQRAFYNSRKTKEAALRAIAMIDSADRAITGIVAPETKLKILEDKEYLFSQIKMTDSAYVYIRKFWALKDSVHSVEKDKQLEELKVQYDVVKQEQENTALQQSNKNKFYLLVILLIGLVAIVCVGILLLRINKLRTRQKTLDLEQKLLRLQMNPHFLFNVINSIQRYILDKEQQNAYDYLAKFSKLMRIILNNSQEKSLSLAQELDMINLYVELEQMRFDNEFDFELRVNENLDLHSTVVPPMLIQPYIENAIWHGIMNLEKARKGKLFVEVGTNGELLKIVIEDNGVGRATTAQMRQKESHIPMGTRLTEQRLLIINKMQEYEKAKVTINDLTNSKGEACGTRVEIILPIERDK